MLFGDKAGEDNCQHFFSPNKCWHPRSGCKAKRCGRAGDRGKRWLSVRLPFQGVVCVGVNIKVSAGECL